MVDAVDKSANIASSQRSLIANNKHEKYFLGDRKTFMKELKDKMEKVTIDLIDDTTDTMTIDGEFIENKNDPGSLFYIQEKLKEFGDINRTIISTFDFLKEMEKEVSRLIS